MGVNKLNYRLYLRLKSRSWGEEGIGSPSRRQVFDVENITEPDANEPDENERDENERDGDEIDEIENTMRELGLLSSKAKITRRSIGSRGNVVYVPLPDAVAANALPFERVEGALPLASLVPTRSPSMGVEGSTLSNAVLPTQKPFDRLENTGKPLLATPKALPGANQKDPFLLMSGSSPTSVPLPTAMIQALPGINQQDPVLDEINATPGPLGLLESFSAQPTSIPAVLSLTMSSQTPIGAIQTTASTTSDLTSTPTSALDSKSTSSTFTTIVSSIAPLETSPKSFIGKEADIPPTSLDSAFLPMSTDPSEATGTPNMLMSSSASVAVISTSTLAAVSLNSPTAAPSIEQYTTRTGLSPVARTIFITFGILGALAILILLIVVMLMRKKRVAAASQPGPSSNDNRFYYPNNGIRVTTRVTANSFSNDDPFLSSEEKANGSRNMAWSSDSNNAGARLQSVPEEEKYFIVDALSSFVEKTRRLTYKITP